MKKLLKILSIISLYFIFNISNSSTNEIDSYLVISTKKIIESQSDPNYKDFKKYKDDKYIILFSPAAASFYEFKNF